MEPTIGFAEYAIGIPIPHISGDMAAAPAIAAAAAEAAIQATAAETVAAAGYEQARWAAVGAEQAYGMDPSQVAYDEMLRTRAVAQEAFGVWGAAQTLAAQTATEAAAMLAAIETTIQAAAAAAIVVTTTTATMLATAEIATKAFAEVTKLQAIFDELFRKYKLEYPPPYPYAEGGIASGPESGYEARLHGTELIVSPRKSYPASVNNDNTILIEEVRKLREEVRAGNYQISKNTLKSAKVLDNTLTKWDDLGMPAVAS